MFCGGAGATENPAFANAANVKTNNNNNIEGLNHVIVVTVKAYSVRRALYLFMSLLEPATKNGLMVVRGNVTRSKNSARESHDSPKCRGFA